ncbi:ABC transporter ATP-binding protein, partial [Pseudomonas sp. GW456-11-11-14-LB2]|uniref:ATP-binding cassette domain-containing protein n=1 Tax=Pseudomonas sp. GW456-11-11-14-LB2 TaxID=2070613 RepID=UPI000CC794DB
MSAVIEPRKDAAAAKTKTGEPLVVAHDLARTFDVSPPWLNRVLERKPRVLLHAVDGVSFSIERGKTLALVGESGCGKSTTGRSLLRLVESQSGAIEFGGKNIRELPTRELQALRRNIQF